MNPNRTRSFTAVVNQLTIRGLVLLAYWFSAPRRMLSRGLTATGLTLALLFASATAALADDPYTTPNCTDTNAFKVGVQALTGSAWGYAEIIFIALFVFSMIGLVIGSMRGGKGMKTFLTVMAVIFLVLFLATPIVSGLIAKAKCA